MDLWIMGLLYKLIVRGSRLHGAFGEKGLVRSVYPTGGMRGRSPVFSLGVWRTACLDGGANKRWVWEMERNVKAEKEPLRPCCCKNHPTTPNTREDKWTSQI